MESKKMYKKYSPELGSGSITELLKTSGIVTKNGGFLMSAVVTAKTTAGLVSLYDGDSDLGKHLTDINVIANDTKQICFDYPIPIDKGIYVKINESTTYCMIQYEPLPAGVEV
jgi:hypothetical protein